MTVCASCYVVQSNLCGVEWEGRQKNKRGEKKIIGKERCVEGDRGLRSV